MPEGRAQGRSTYELCWGHQRLTLQLKLRSMEAQAATEHIWNKIEFERAESSTCTQSAATQKLMTL